MKTTFSSSSYSHQTSSSSPRYLIITMSSAKQLSSHPSTSHSILVTNLPVCLSTTRIKFYLVNFQSKFHLFFQSKGKKEPERDSPITASWTCLFFPLKTRQTNFAQTCFTNKYKLVVGSGLLLRMRMRNRSQDLENGELCWLRRHRGMVRGKCHLRAFNTNVHHCHGPRSSLY